jgi:hypothetical protein
VALHEAAKDGLVVSQRRQRATRQTSSAQMAKGQEGENVQQQLSRQLSNAAATRGVLFHCDATLRNSVF